MRQFAIIGLGTFGFKLASALAELGCQVLAVDNDRDRVQEIRDLVTEAVVLDLKSACWLPFTSRRPVSKKSWSKH
jgi:trk system potassium uptake protein TrkA